MSPSGNEAANSPLGEEVKMRVPFYYSSNPSDPDVYHWHDNCPTGKQIPSWNKMQGRPPGYRECKQCIDLGR